MTTDKAPTGGGQYVSVIARSVAGGSEYRGKLLLGSTGAVTAYLARIDGGVETVSAPPPSPVSPTPRVRSPGTGPGRRARPRRRSGSRCGREPAEPSAWLLSRTDSTAGLQTAGSVGFYDYVSGSATNAPVVFRHDDLWVGPPQP